jgi:hypothetical protein
MQTLLRLRRFATAPPPHFARAAQCELCDAPLALEHSHVVALEERRLVCACRPCYLLFTNAGAANGRFRAVGERCRRLAGDAAEWETLDIPTGLAFFIRSSSPARVTAFYPSPGGATESGLPLDRWRDMVRNQPELASLECDIEALLLYRRRARTECWIVPVDLCYELVGRLRRSWRGFDGGEQAAGELDSFFRKLAAKEQDCAA